MTREAEMFISHLLIILYKALRKHFTVIMKLRERNVELQLIVCFIWQTN